MQDPEMARANKTMYRKVESKAKSILGKHEDVLMKKARELSPSQLKAYLRAHKTSKHKRCESFHKMVEANMPGVTTHGRQLP